MIPKKPLIFCKSNLPIYPFPIWIQNNGVFDFGIKSQIENLYQIINGCYAQCFQYPFKAGQSICAWREKEFVGQIQYILQSISLGTSQLTF